MKKVTMFFQNMINRNIDTNNVQKCIKFTFVKV